VIHGAVVSVPTILLLLGTAPWWTLGVGGSLITLTYLTFGRIESQRQDFWLTPLSFFFFWYSVGYGLSAIYAASEAYSTGYLTLVGHTIEGQDLAEGYVLSLIGAVSLHAGYSWLKSFQYIAPEIHTKQRSDLRIWGLAFLVGITMMLRPDPFAGIGVARAILKLSPFGVLVSYLSFPRQFFRMSAGLYFFYGALGSLILIASAFYEGSKFVSMLSFLPLLSAFLVRPRWRRLLPVLLIFGSLIYLFVVSPVLMGVRDIKNVDSQWEKLKIAADESLSSAQEDVLFTFQYQSQRFLYRQFESTAVGFIVGEVRQHGLQYGATMQNLGYAFIPRVLWKEKPIVTRGTWFTAYLGGSGSEEESKTSTGMYSAGELYWNFGVAGVIVGMLLMGMMLGFLFSAVGDGPHKLVVPMILFINILAHIVDQAAATEVIILLVYLVLATVAYRYVLTITKIKNKPGALRFRPAMRR